MRSQTTTLAFHQRARPTRSGDHGRHAVAAARRAPRFPDGPAHRRAALIAVRPARTTSCTPSLGNVAGDNPETRRSTPPGEGERRALSGYLPQYKVAAARILQAFAAGTLHAVAVADPEGGAVDDLQLLTGHLDALRVDGFQVKWSATAAPLADADLRSLICDAVAGRGLLQTAWVGRTTPGGERVTRTVIHLHTNRPLSTAGLRGPNVHGRGLTLPRFVNEIWRPAQAGALMMLDDVPQPWRPYLVKLATEAGVTETELLAAARDILIETDRRLPEDDRETGRAFLHDLRAFVLGLQEAVADDAISSCSTPQRSSTSSVRSSPLGGGPGHSIRSRSRQTSSPWPPRHKRWSVRLLSSRRATSCSPAVQALASPRS